MYSYPMICVRRRPSKETSSQFPEAEYYDVLLRPTDWLLQIVGRSKRSLSVVVKRGHPKSDLVNILLSLNPIIVIRRDSRLSKVGRKREKNFPIWMIRVHVGIIDQATSFEYDSLFCIRLERWSQSKRILI